MSKSSNDCSRLSLWVSAWSHYLIDLDIIFTTNNLTISKFHSLPREIELSFESSGGFPSKD